MTNYAECWAGPYIENNFDVDGPSRQCLSGIPVLNPSRNYTNASNHNDISLGVPGPGKYELCGIGQLQCAGTVGSSYVFALDNGMSSL